MLHQQKFRSECERTGEVRADAHRSWQRDRRLIQPGRFDIAFLGQPRHEIPRLATHRIDVQRERQRKVLHQRRPLRA